MRVFAVLGVCVLLIGVNVEAAKGKQNRNQAEFFELWETENAEGRKPEDFDKEFIIDDEGSGFDDRDDIDVAVNTHEDDEDFPSSGDGEPEEIVKGNKDGNQGNRPTDDEDDLYEESGSGAGEDMAVVDTINKESIIGTEMTPKPNPPTKLSPCEQWRASAKDVGDFVPDCDLEGAFARMQCRPVDPKTKQQSCWCVTQRDGTQVPGTLMVSPDKPDCLFGNNLKGCVFQLVQNGQNLLGAEVPRCDLNGDWEPVQCHGSKCWCVDELGNQKLGSITDLPQMPNCDADKLPVKPKTGKPTIAPTPKDVGGYTVDTNINKNVVVTVSDKGYGDQDDELQNTEGGFAPVEHQREPILGQPGFLAAIIAGGVITLLLIVLLVMFVVYRWRKKDEGSYPLDDQKYQNYSYAKAPDKEFYA